MFQVESYRSLEGVSANSSLQLPLRYGVCVRLDVMYVFAVVPECGLTDTRHPCGLMFHLATLAGGVMGRQAAKREEAKGACTGTGSAAGLLWLFALF